MTKKLLLAACSIGLAASTFAQDAPRKDDYTIVTDRPSISYSSSTVPRGIFQFESGYQFTKIKLRDFDDTYTTIQNIPNIVFRTGITDRWELHLGWDLLRSKSVISGLEFDPEIYSNALTLATRVAITDKAEGWMPEMTFFGGMVLPMTTSTPDAGIGTQFRFCMQHYPTDKISVFYNVGADFFESSNGIGSFIQTNFAYTLGANYAVNDHVNLYGEVFGFQPRMYDGHTFGADGGLVYLLNKQIQFDAVGGFSINEYTVSPYFMLGFSAYIK